MTGALRWAAVLWASCLLLACHPRKQSSAVDAEAIDGEGTEASAAGNPAEAPAPAASAVAGEPTRKPVTLRCAGGEVAVLLKTGDETCVVECKSGAACPPGWGCDGDGTLFTGGRRGGEVQFCRAAAGGGGGGGGAKGADAGPSSAGTVDAGGATQQAKDAGPPPKRLDVKPTAGNCPAGYHTCGAICRLGCAKDGDCGLATAHCQAGLCMGPGTKPCAK
jgi:hypothetical protein